MHLLDFMEEVKLAEKIESDRAKLLCFYHYKEDGNTVFAMSDISRWMEECNFNKPNVSRLKNNLTKGKSKAFLHCFMKHTIRAPREPLLQELKMKSPGDVYTVNVSLYVCPSTRCAMNESGTVRAANDARAKTTVAQRYKGETFKRPASRQVMSRTEGSVK